MTISGRIRIALEKFPETSGSLTPPSSPIAPRQVYHDFALARRLRQSPIASTDSPNAALMAEVQSRLRSSPRPESPVHLLWTHWLSLLAADRLALPAKPHALSALWSRAFTHQHLGPLHPLTPDTLLDAFVYDDLCALHAAYNSALLLHNAEMLDEVRSAVRWHVQNTQPDHTTAEPWALAAFDALDDTHTFAEQQLHNALAHLSNDPRPLNPPSLIPALLTDALASMEQRTQTP